MPRLQERCTRHCGPAPSLPHSLAWGFDLVEQQTPPGAARTTSDHASRSKANPQAKARVSTFIESLGLRPLDVGGLHMAQTLEALGLMMIGLAKNGAGTWDIALNVDIG
jgi:hypothetical protein